MEYLKEAPTSSQVNFLITALGGSAHDLLRTKEAAYKQHGLSEASSDEAITAAIASAPILLERPIVVVGDKAAIGRPPQNVLTLLPVALDPAQGA